MTLFTPEQRRRLIENGKPENRDQDHAPVVRLYLPGTDIVWMLNELDETEPLAFGLCDLGMGHPELGYVSMDELTEAETPWGSRVTAEPDFEGAYPMSIYAEAARVRGFINTDEDLLQRLATTERNQFVMKFQP